VLASTIFGVEPLFIEANWLAESGLQSECKAIDQNELATAFKYFERGT
jgi:hypothetical protein